MTESGAGRWSERGDHGVVLPAGARRSINRKISEPAAAGAHVRADALLQGHDHGPYHRVMSIIDEADFTRKIDK
jgi:hypothetical protein